MKLAIKPGGILNLFRLKTALRKYHKRKETIRVLEEIAACPEFLFGGFSLPARHTMDEFIGLAPLPRVERLARRGTSVTYQGANTKILKNSIGQPYAATKENTTT